ncbi:FCD domain-containing protein [Citricoccus sp.]|uniref:FadR/GntR family transcriptional regulator n=1 Tax=Citricoccus sp. TaxID=1978372 RepID=UPI0028BDE577|nr:FCD domain-containing protein [Citricoccus sp.]
MARDLGGLVEALLDEVTPDAAGRLKLPPERELGVSLDVSRNMLREQLGTLETLGFVNRTQGRGTFLDAPDAAFTQLYFRLALRLGHITEDQFGQARRMLEQAVVEEAVKTASDRDLERLRTEVDRMVDASAAGDVTTATAADFAFHRYLYRIVDNPVFNFMHDGLSHVLRDVVAERRAQAAEVEQPGPDGRREVDIVHYELVEALEARDVEAARRATRRHFEVWSSLTSN